MAKLRTQPSPPAGGPPVEVEYPIGVGGQNDVEPAGEHSREPCILDPLQLNAALNLTDGDHAHELVGGSLFSDPGD